MKTTAAVLHDLQNYYDLMDAKPKHADIAAAANLPKATVTRYLNGTTKSGDPERVRALCIALDREDLVSKLPVKPTIVSTMDVWELLADQKLTDRESNLEEVGYERKLREESEKRLIDEMERMQDSKSKSISMLISRTEKLENDKRDLHVRNSSLHESITKLTKHNAELLTELTVVCKTKRRHDALLVISLAIIALLLASVIAYLIKFDIPNPGYGLFRQ